MFAPPRMLSAVPSLIVLQPVRSLDVVAVLRTETVVEDAASWLPKKRYVEAFA